LNCFFPEFAGQGFWLPGGAVDAGETFSQAAIRECMEEAGVMIVLKGLLAIEMHPFEPHHRDQTNVVRMRAIFYAEPISSFLDSGGFPKSIPDFESAGACWVSYEDMCGGLLLRGSEPLDWAR
jgi:ADP-ribose pyrophosphatase YjhB (NUDIX family)